MAEKVLLISPQYRIVRNPKSEMSKNTHRRAQPPLGILSIGSNLVEKGYDVLCLDSVIEGINETHYYDEVTDYYGLDVESIAKIAEDYGPSYIGIGCLTTSQYPLARKIRGAVSYIAPTVMGGNHPTLDSKNIDGVFLGEADLIKPYDWFSGKREMLYDMNNAPKPNWDIIPLKKYWEDALPQNPYSKSRKTILYETSRGCCEECTFCSTRMFFGSKFRAKSAEKVVSEITHAVDRYGVEEVQFVDDSMALNLKRFDEICDGLAPLGVHLCNPSGIRFYLKDMERIRQTFEKMKSAGFYQMTFAIESGNEHVLNNIIKKRLDLQWVEKVVAIAKDYFKVHAFFMIGLPTETEAQIYDTINFARKIKVDSYSLSLAQPFPHTKLWYDYQDMMLPGIKESDMLLGKQVFKRKDNLNLEKLAEEVIESLNNMHR